MLKSNDLEISFDAEYTKPKYQDVFRESHFEATDLLQKADLDQESGKLSIKEIMK